MRPVREFTSDDFERWLEAFRAHELPGAPGSRLRIRLVGRIMLGRLLVLVALSLALIAGLASGDQAGEGGPRPVIDELVVTPSAIEPGSPVTIEMRVTNAGDQDTRDGGMTFSFPRLTDPEDGGRVVRIDAPPELNVHVMPSGQRLTNRLGSPMAARYLVVEAQGGWPAGEQKIFRVVIVPDQPGEFEINARSAMASPTWRYSNTPQRSAHSDQQGWNVIREIVAVSAPAVAALVEPQPEPEPEPEPAIEPAVGPPAPAMELEPRERPAEPAHFVTPSTLPELNGHSWVVRNWDVRHGLPQNSARSIRQSSDGYLWIGTQGGLSRFDGTRFTSFRVADYPDLGSNRILALLEDSSGQMWIGTEDGGLVWRRDGRFERLPVCGQRCMVSGMIKSGTDDLWINTTAGIFNIDPGTGWVHEQKQLPGHFAHGGAMIWHPQLGLVVSSQHELVYWHAGGREPHTARTPDGSAINALMQMGNAVWVATTTTVFVWEDGQMRPLLDADGRAAPGAGALLEDADGSVWMSLDGGGLVRRSRRGDMRQVRQFGGQSIDTMTFDAEGNLWLGSAVDGLFRLQPSRIRSLSNYGEALAAPAMPILGDGAGGVLIGQACGGLVQLRADGRLLKLHEAAPDLERCVWTLHREPDGSLLIGSRNGAVQRYHNGRVDNLRFRDGTVAYLPARMFHRDRQGRLWLGTDLGLFRVDDDVIVPVVDGPREMFLSVHERPDGDMVYGTGNGLVRFNGYAFRRIETGTVLDILPVRSLHSDRDGVLWLGTYGGGLWRHFNDDWFQITPRDGLYDDVVSCILEDRAGRLWMSGNRGIFQARRGDLNDLATGETTYVASPGLNRYDGMPTDETNGGGQPACYEDAAGNFWFPTIRGPVVIDPDDVSRQIPSPPLKIESAHLDGQQVSIEQGLLNLPAGARNLEINYTALYLTAPERLQFRYRLAGYEDDWTMAGTRRTAYYPILPAGSYRFEFQAGTDYGTWFPVRSSVEINLPKRLLEQPVFFLGLGVLVILAIILFTRWRMLELEHRDQELQSQVEMRTRELRENNLALARLAQVDELTGIANYRRFRLYLNEQWERCLEIGQRLSVIVIDVDKFKPYNDALGHQAGDECLRSLAQSLDVMVQARGGLLARYGGEEFLAVLPGQEINEAAKIAEQLRQAVEALGIARPEPERGVLTASFGVGSMQPTDINDPDQLIASADRALYKAKEKGRNRVEIEQPDDSDRPRPNLRWARNDGKS